MAINTTPATVQISFTSDNGRKPAVIVLPEGETAEQMSRRLTALLNHQSIDVRSVTHYKAKSESDYQKEWMAAVANGGTTDGLNDWYRCEYGE